MPIETADICSKYLSAVLPFLPSCSKSIVLCWTQEKSKIQSRDLEEKKSVELQHKSSRAEGEQRVTHPHGEHMAAAEGTVHPVMSTRGAQST